MAFQFGKHTEQMVADSVRDLKAKYEEIEAAVECFNASLMRELEELNEKVGQYNACLEDARNVVEELHGDMQGEYDDKSERWQEGDKGSTTADWIEELNGIELDEVDNFSMEPLEMFTSHADALEALPSEPSY